jgi:hypothetical protein
MQMNPQHDDRTDRPDEGMDSSARHDRRERRVLALATLTAALSLAVTVGGLALSALGRPEVPQPTTATRITPQRPSSVASKATPVTAATATADKPSVIVREIVREITPTPEFVDHGFHVAQTIVSPFDGSEISIAYSENVAMLVRRAPGGPEEPAFYALQGYEFSDMIGLPGEPALVLRVADQSGTGAVPGGVYKIGFDGSTMYVAPDAPAEPGFGGISYRPHGLSYDAGHVLLYQYLGDSPVTCRLLAMPLYGGPPVPLYPAELDNHGYPYPISGCAYVMAHPGGSVSFSVTESGHPANVLEEYQGRIDTGELILLDSYAAPPLEGESPPPAEEDRFALLGLSEAVAYDFLAHLQGLVAAGDREQLAQWVAYPLDVTIDGAPATVYGPEEFVANYDAIIHEGVSGALLSQSPEGLFVNDQGIMIGNGELWLHPTQPGVIQIIGINN